MSFLSPLFSVGLKGDVHKAQSDVSPGIGTVSLENRVGSHPSRICFRFFMEKPFFLQFFFFRCIPSFDRYVTL